MTPSIVQDNVFKRKGGMLKIHMLSYLLKSIKYIGLSEDYTSHPILDSDLLLVEKNDQLGYDDFDLLECLRNPISDCSFENDFGCDPLFDTPPLFDKYGDEFVDLYDNLSCDPFDVNGGFVST